MGRMASCRGRSCLSLALALALLTGPVAANTPAATVAGETLRSPDPWTGIGHSQPAAESPPAGPSYRVLVISAGALAGVVVGIVITSGLATPAGAAALATPAVTLAARNGAVYAARAVTIVFSAAIGGLMADWLYRGR